MKYKRILLTGVISLVTLLNSFLVLVVPDEIYLFRHSEKLAGKNPDLSDAGKLRASHLVTLLKKYKKVHIYSSNYKRTLQSAKPLSEHFNEQISTYDARELPAFKDELLKLNGVVIVIGHSNTTPRLAALLSNETITPMSESEFSRYFLLSKSVNQNTNEYSVAEHKMNF
ncbi:histidine phosphatase family protein [Pseudoalteromonas sp. MMG006]|uniref:SixA phosphatase family protein n=1 Tax=Pseudoalteromonas sp. MMG006 TaxID=2822683 RepID=UPI001B383AC1|nr:histidine phosphatase family protein [Pseudoalteromonas sp. MMG006]MBQ4797936.1 histidine phosphatase family protein [Pseudoalteromonas sp. MMG006]